MSDIGKEIVDAAEAEVAKRFSGTPHHHWRRHDDGAIIRGAIYSVTACGHLVLSDDCHPEPEGIDCRECAEVFFVVNPPPWVSGGV